jgi:hypothetical protein
MAKPIWIVGLGAALWVLPTGAPAEEPMGREAHERDVELMRTIHTEGADPREVAAELNRREQARLVRGADEVRAELDQAIADGDEARQAELLGTLGALHLRMDRPDESIAYFKASADLHTSLGNAAEAKKMRTMARLVDSHREP